jgi:predicted nucleotidyltransferase
LNFLHDIDPYFQDLPLAQRDSLRKRLSILLKGREEIIFAYLHGSFVTGIPFKDIDIALYVDIQRVAANQHQEYREQLSEELSNILHQIFDVSLMNNTPASFNLTIFKEGELLFSKDETLRTDLIEASSLSSMRDEAFSMQYLREIVF